MFGHHPYLLSAECLLAEEKNINIPNSRPHPIPFRYLRRHFNLSIFDTPFPLCCQPRGAYWWYDGTLRLVAPSCALEVKGRCALASGGEINYVTIIDLCIRYPAREVR